jgi:hypothetical protein
LNDARLTGGFCIYLGVRKSTVVFDAPYIGLKRPALKAETGTLSGGANS